ncbi:MBL fold metallo-hydrolase [Simplicispira metamorpha]|uniref:Glyoxylase-like metal-dependent hydrolase (Beta-lactamase superfamily II) n=1 Tax=Simplicispira metamorpha TaxID=80881 RepID=A0A4V2SJ24_9BURK|nr:MBL fold metallo-hydrolase [Simplicispira metamorpha]TCP12690.1 glyoxylase-like metal-dependent hydrolase (beta-lactamase superfamily II) [Simplicispira metamorpha]
MTRLSARAVQDYPFSAPDCDGSVVEVAPGILWARMPMPMALDHINVYLLRGDDGWTLIDTGLNTPAARDCWEHIASTHLQGLPIVRLVCTHMHYDHAGLSHWLCERFGIPLYMTHGEYFMMRTLAEPVPDPLPSDQAVFYARSGMPPERTERMWKAMRADPFMPPQPQSFHRLRGGDDITLGSRTWRVVIGEGHSPEHACLYCAQDEILIAGDQLLPRISSNVLVTSIEPEANPLQLWLESLTRLERLAPGTLVLPSHERVFRGLHPRTQELREHHGQQLGQLRDHLAEHGTCTAFDAMLCLFPRLRTPVDDMLALGETIAHLSWLRYSGVLRRVLDEDGIYRFALTDPAAATPPETPEPSEEADISYARH